MGIEAYTTVKMLFIVPELGAEQQKAEEAIEKLHKSVSSNSIVCESIEGEDGLKQIDYFARISNDRILKGLTFTVYDTNFLMYRYGFKAIMDGVTDWNTINSWKDPEDWDSDLSAFAKHYGCILLTKTAVSPIEGTNEVRIFGANGTFWHKSVTYGWDFLCDDSIYRDFIVRHILDDEADELQLMDKSNDTSDGQ